MPRYVNCYCRLKAYNFCNDFLDRKINLSGISPAKRSRSEPNSTYVDASRGDNVEEILGAIGPFWEKWGLGQIPRSASFLCGKPRDLSATLQRPIFTKFGHETYFGVPSRNPERHSTKIFTLGVICSQNLKSKIGQTGTSLRTGTGHVMQCIEILFTPRCSPRAVEFPTLINFSVRRTVAELRGVKVAQFSDFGLFSHTKPLQRTFQQSFPATSDRGAGAKFSPMANCYIHTECNWTARHI